MSERGPPRWQRETTRHRTSGLDWWRGTARTGRVRLDAREQGQLAVILRTGLAAVGFELCVPRQVAGTVRRMEDVPAELEQYAAAVGALYARGWLLRSRPESAFASDVEQEPAVLAAARTHLMLVRGDG